MSWVSGGLMSGLLVDDLRGELARGRVIVLVGAGVSAGATGGAPAASWTGLLENGVARCEELAVRPLPAGWGDRVRAQIQSGDVEELILAAEAVTYRLGGRDHGEYRRWLKETVGGLGASYLEVLEALRDLGGILATTNYDGLLEQVTRRPAVTWQDQARAQAVLRGGEQAVLHLHGFWQEPESVVLGVRSYEELLGAEHAQAMQQAMTAMGTLLFVGFGAGLADPNFTALRTWTARLFRGGEYRHFRLAKDDEVAALRAEHGQDERVFVLGYGPGHADLAPYLRRLAPAPPPPADGAANPPPQTRPRGPGGLPPVWNLPYASNPSFTGRAAVLDGLHAGLTRERGMVHPQVIAGTGGVGKTQLAVEYAWRHRGDYDSVLVDPRRDQRQPARRLRRPGPPGRTGPRPQPGHDGGGRAGLAGGPPALAGDLRQRRRPCGDRPAAAPRPATVTCSSPPSRKTTWAGGPTWSRWTC